MKSYFKSLLGMLALFLGMVSFDRVANAAVGTPGAYAAAGRVKLTSTAVTVSAWTQIVSAIPTAIKGVMVYSTATTPLQISVGAAGSEAVQLIIPASLSSVNAAPVFLPMAVPQGARLALEAIDTTASVGEVQINAVYN